MVPISRARGLLCSAAAYCLHPGLIIIFSLAYSARSQNPIQPTTDPSEARALNTIFQKWGIQAPASQWNISGELCSGVAVDQGTQLSDSDKNPLIKCDCKFNDSSICHITALKVFKMSVTGPIPDELWSLTYLNDLNLGNNVLTGPISPFIGNLTQMKWLNFGVNALSGEIPKELEKLTNLITLGLGANNFSGSLPPELGDLRNLAELYISSCGISGTVPSTFANLQNLTTLRAQDNMLSGPIPDVIGKLALLKQLFLHGNSFDGPIPSSLSTLISLTDLRISGLLSGSSSLAFIRDMKNLQVLILRNNNITDSIPSVIAEFSGLQQLDLSFNKLYGEIPDSLFNMNSLSFLFLGNNSLSGNLPALKTSNLVNIDLSYNFLTGRLPSWVNNAEDIKLNLTLVGNNFTKLDLKDSNLPSGLISLQRNFPRGKPIYSSFAINCGGPKIRSSSGVVYERDDNSLGPATYYVSDTKRWAVSNVGYFIGSTNASYTSISASNVTGILDPELYHTARMSASSLRYYGLMLENGNYTVSLQFAESAFTSSTWKSRGRRMFDIYIQGNIVAKDFDIQKEAQGASDKAVVKSFTALVTENHLEIHLFWAGKGTLSVPEQGVFGPTISAISTTPNFIPPGSRSYSTGLQVAVVIGVVVLGLLVVFLALFFIRRRKQRRPYKGGELLGIDTRPCTFSYADLNAATDEFSSVNKLGEGGFGPVFKGKLNDGRVIAVKQLSLTSHQGDNQFVTEIATMSAVQHRNLVKLYGCCIEVDKRLLVYEFLENKSLDQALFGQKYLNLDWPTRHQICLGIARGLAYLHEGSRMRIVHRDVKASNILLDSDFTPKISDFGLAKLYDMGKTHMSTRVAGTIGYLAPEYAMRGHLTEKADVFAFGVVALEVLSGRSNSDQSLGQDEIYLLEWAWNLREQNRETELVDSRLSDFNEEEAKRVLHIALQCTQTSPAARPAMSRVVAMLTGDTEVSAITTKPGYLTDWRHLEDDDTTSLIMEAERNGAPPNSTRYPSTEIASPSQPIMIDIVGGR